MKTLLRAAVCSISLFCLLACSTVRVMSPPTAAKLTRHVEIGDTARITMKDNSYFHMKVTAIGDTEITGLWPRNRQSYTKPYADIRKIEVEKLSYSKTIGGLGGTFVVVCVIGLAVFAYALEHSDWGPAK